MKVGRILFSIGVLGSMALGSSTFARWSEPVPVVEINSTYSDKTPFLSYDGLTIYFSRQNEPGWYYTRLYQATRPEPFGTFTSVQEISALNYPNGHVDYAWVSPDNLRMYYYRTEGSIRRLKITERESIDESWEPGININELNILGDVANPSLTQDELVIFFAGGNLPGGFGEYDIWMATRLDRNSPFKNIVNLREINTSMLDLHPSISPDGLTLYFDSNRNGTSQLFRATRESLDAQFDNVEHLSFFDSPESSVHYPSPSKDGTTFYFVRRPENGIADIYVSYISDVSEAVTYYVDAIYGSDLNNGMSPETAFVTIQNGIDSARDGDTVLVYPGLYTEEVNFQGKAITVQGVAGIAGVPVLESLDGFAVSFYYGEGPDSTLKNFVIRNSFIAVVIIRSSPTISNVTVVNNEYGIEAYAGSEPDISNSIFWNNISRDLFGCEARYSWVQDEVENEPYDGPISYWSFDEDIGNVAFDTIGGSHGTIYGGASRTESVSGKAIQFDGVDDYVSVPYSDVFQLSVFTIGVWIRPEMELLTTGGVIVGRGEDFNTDLASYVFDVRHPDSNFGTGIRLMYEENNDRERHYSTGVFPQVGTWTHLVVSRSLSGQVIIYQDGYVLGQWDSTPTPTTQSFQCLTFGARWASGTTSGPYRLIHFFPGLIDEIKIYDRALSDEEVQRLYRNELGESGFVNNPLFADPSSGDYHLLSERGRYWPEHDVWVLDGITSPCVDGGDPDVDYSDEPMPNGDRINMGAYGGTPFASMSEIQ